jgi:hypothetical protein
MADWKYLHFTLSENNKNLKTKNELSKLFKLKNIYFFKFLKIFRK